MHLAIDMYDRATALDPGFGPAFAKKALAHTWMWWWMYDRTNDRLASAKRAADRAVALDPDLPEGHMAQGLYYGVQIELDSAEYHYGIARRLRPNDSELLILIGHIKRQRGEWEDALASYDQAAILDPRNVASLGEAGFTHLYLRAWDEADRLISRAVTVDPNALMAHLLQSETYLVADGDLQRVRPVLRDAVDRFGPGPFSLMANRPVISMMALDDPEFRTALDGATPSASLLQNDADYYLLKADVRRLSGEIQSARVYYDSVRTFVDSILPSVLRETQPRSIYTARLYSQLGLALAGLGDEAAAIEAGTNAVRFLPLSADHMFGVDPLRDLANIYVMVGQHDAAMDLFEELLAVPSPVSKTLLRVHPRYADLRGNPRFEALIREN